MTVNIVNEIKQPGSLLEQTLAAAARDAQMVTPEGKPLRRLTEGVMIRDVPTHSDARGSLFEMFDPRWGWHPEPLVFVYCFSLRPGFAKGWNLHKEHEDRYIVMNGEMELVLYDPRPDSSTCGEVCSIVLSEHRRQVVNVPKFVWHADHNIGTTDVLVVNLPTRSYDHVNPDKYRLPLDTPLIPHRFERVQGW
jgi:dTDP-4-dehydrorhamnose 3,5-epimerase